MKKRNTRIITDIYYKVTNTHKYLHFHTCHPHQTKTFIPYNLARRICTIVSENDTRDTRLTELKTYLLKTEQIIDNGIYKAKEHERSELLLTRRHERNSNLIPFVHTHNPRNQNVKCIKNQLNTILKEDQATRGVFENARFISSKRQPRNLKGLLCNSKFKENHSVTKCNNPRCGTFNHLTEGTFF